MKKLFALLLALVFVLSPALSEIVPQPASPFKIILVTKSSDEGLKEDDLVNKLKEQYHDILVVSTYTKDEAAENPDAISAKLLAFAEDPQVKAIIVCPGPIGTAAAFTKIRNDLRSEDILLIAGLPSEEAREIAAAADIVLDVDGWDETTAMPNEQEESELERMTSFVTAAIIKGGLQYAKQVNSTDPQSGSPGVDLIHAFAQAVGSGVEIGNFEDGDGKVFDNYFILQFDQADLAV